MRCAKTTSSSAPSPSSDATRRVTKNVGMPPARDAAKRRALQVLKQKRLYENQREQLYNQQFNLEQVGFATQTAKETVVQVEAMRAANKGAF